jgi:hypothetical protein
VGVEVDGGVDVVGGGDAVGDGVADGDGCGVAVAVGLGDAVAVAVGNAVAVAEGTGVTSTLEHAAAKASAAGRAMASQGARDENLDSNFARLPSRKDERGAHRPWPILIAIRLDALDAAPA